MTSPIVKAPPAEDILRAIEKAKDIQSGMKEGEYLLMDNNGTCYVGSIIEISVKATVLAANQYSPDFYVTDTKK